MSPVSNSKKRKSGGDILSRSSKGQRNRNIMNKKNIKPNTLDESLDEVFEFDDDDDGQLRNGAFDSGANGDGKGDFCSSNEEGFSDGDSDSSSDHIESVWAGVLEKRRHDFEAKIKKMKRQGIADIKDRAASLTSKLGSTTAPGDVKAARGLQELIKELKKMLESFSESENGPVTDKRVLAAVDAVQAKKQKVRETQIKVKSSLSKIATLSEEEAVNNSEASAEAEEFASALSDVMAQWISIGGSLEDAVYTSIATEPTIA